MLEGKMGRRWLAGLVGAVALFVAAVVSADEGQIQGTLTSVPETPVAVGEALQFSVEELDFELDLPVGEWWVMSGSAWTFEWIVDDRVEAVTDSHTWTPSDAAFADTGAYEVECRVTFCYEIQYEEAGQPVSVGPHTAMALFEYPTPFEVVGLAEPLYYRYDGEETWAIAPPILHVEPGAQLLFSVEPEGAAAFPMDEPVWTVAGVTTATGSQQIAWQAPDASQATATDITVSCGAESLSTAVQVVAVAELQWKLNGTDVFFQAVPESGHLYLPAGSAVLFRAVPSYGATGWPSGSPVWSGADPVQGTELPGRAAMVLGTTPVTVQAAVAGQTDPPETTLDPLTIEGLSVKGNGTGDTWGGGVIDPAGTPGFFAPVGLDGTFSVKFVGYPQESPPPVAEHLLTWTGDGFPIAKHGLHPTTAWDGVSGGVNDRLIELTFGAQVWKMLFTVVGIDRLEYTSGDGTWDEAAGTILVGFNDSPQLRAIPLPNAADFPATFPRWSGVTGSGEGPVEPVFWFGNGYAYNAQVQASCGTEQECRLTMLKENMGYMVIPDSVALEANVGATTGVSSYAILYHAPVPPATEPTFTADPWPGSWYLHKGTDDDATGALTEGADGASATVEALEPGSISIWVRDPQADPPDPSTDSPALRIDSVALACLYYSVGSHSGMTADGPLIVQRGSMLHLSAMRMGGGASCLWPPNRPDWTMPAGGEDGVPTQIVRLSSTGHGGWYEAKCGRARDENGTLQDCVDGIDVVVCTLGSLTVNAAGLSSASCTDATPYTEPAHAHDTLYVGPDVDGRISFEINVGWGSTGNNLDPSHVKWAIQYPTAQGGWATATTGDGYQDGTFGGFSLAFGAPSSDDPICGDLTDGDTVYVDWQLPRNIDYRLDTFRVRVWFDDTVKHEGTAHELCVPVTIVKPDMIIHRPKEVDTNESAIAFENEEDPGLYLSVNDDWDSRRTDPPNDPDGDPIPDNDDNAITGNVDQQAADRADMARLDLTALAALADCNGWALRFSATGTGRVRLFREGENAQLWDSGSGPAVFAGLFEYLARNGQSLYVEGVEPGVVDITLTTLDEVGDEVSADMLRFTVLSAKLIPDYNRDGAIDTLDVARVLMGETFYFWINDDDDEGFEDDSKAGMMDIPEPVPLWEESLGWTKDCSDLQVDGVRDVIDFFPVFIELKETIDLLGTDDFIYTLSSYSGINAYLATDLGPGDAREHIDVYSYVTAIAEAGLTPIPPSGVTLPADFLAGVQAGKGVVLLEGTAPSGDGGLLVLRVKTDSGETIYQRVLGLSLDRVENMFLHLNIRNAAGAAETVADRLIAPNWPDRLCNGKHFVFVHGYNVNEQCARGWQSEMFKRMHWSGSNARFHGVTWYGHKSAWWYPLVGRKCPRYHNNVVNAWNSSDKLLEYLQDIQSLGTGDTCIAAHSLGNMLTSFALLDDPDVVDTFFMLNAAVASEAYNPAVSDADMVHCDWAPYGDAGLQDLFAANWHERFATPDERKMLTWGGLFQTLATKCVNLHSDGDQVFEGHARDSEPGIFEVMPHIKSGRYSWAYQEKRKGCQYFPAGDDYTFSSFAGWGFNDEPEPVGWARWTLLHPGAVPPDNEHGYVLIDAATAALESPSANLVLRPFFGMGGGDFRERLFQPDQTVASDWLRAGEESPSEIEVRILAGAIPALSFAAGHDKITGVSSVDLQGLQSDWPDRGAPWFTRWLHSDLRNMAYIHTRLAFDEIVDEGALQ